MRSNLHPADRDVRVRIRNLEEEEAALRNFLLEHETHRVGDEHVAQVGMPHPWPTPAAGPQGLAREPVGTSPMRWNRLRQLTGEPRTVTACLRQGGPLFN
jgi:hypothetical protein